MAESKKIAWTKVCETIEKEQGIPKATCQEVFNGATTVIGKILKDESPQLKENESLVITTPLAAIVAKHVPAHTEKDDKGKEYECSAAIGLTASLPTEFLSIANTGFSVTRKEIK